MTLASLKDLVVLERLSIPQFLFTRSLIPSKPGLKVVIGKTESFSFCVAVTFLDNCPPIEILHLLKCIQEKLFGIASSNEMEGYHLGVFQKVSLPATYTFKPQILAI